MTQQSFDVTLEDARAEDELTDEELDQVAGGTGPISLAPGGHAVQNPSQVVWSDLMPFGSQTFNP